jgi:hypothetical protein
MVFQAVWGIVFIKVDFFMSFVSKTLGQSGEKS